MEASLDEKEAMHTRIDNGFEKLSGGKDNISDEVTPGYVRADGAERGRQDTHESRTCWLVPVFPFPLQSWGIPMLLFVCQLIVLLPDKNHDGDRAAKALPDTSLQEGTAGEPAEAEPDSREVRREQPRAVILDQSLDGASNGAHSEMLFRSSKHWLHRNAAGHQQAIHQAEVSLDEGWCWTKRDGPKQLLALPHLANWESTSLTIWRAIDGNNLIAAQNHQMCHFSQNGGIDIGCSLPIGTSQARRDEPCQMIHRDTPCCIG